MAKRRARPAGGAEHESAGQLLRQRRGGELLEHAQRRTRLPPPFASRTEAANALFDYIETFHNRERRHRALGFMSPVEFETQIHLN